MLPELNMPGVSNLIRISSLPALVLGGVTTYVGLHYLLIYLRRRQVRHHLTFSLTCLAVALYDFHCFGLYNAASPAEGVRWLYGQVLMLGFISVTWVWFVSDYLQLGRRRVVIGLGVYVLLLAPLLVLDRHFGLGWCWQADVPAVKTVELFGSEWITYQEVAPGPILILHGGLGFVVHIYVLWQTIRCYRSPRRPLVRPLLIGMAIFFPGLTNDIVVGIGLYTFPYLIEYAYMPLVAVMAFRLSTELAQAGDVRDALRTTQAQFRALAEAAPLPLVIIAADGGIQFANREFAATFGRHDFGRVRDWLDQCCPNAAMRRRTEALLQSRDAAPTMQKLELQDAADRTRVLLTWAVPLGHDRFAVLANDITEREDAAERIRQANAALEDRVADRTRQHEHANRELEAFCYSVSHDLRAPLRSINGFSQALLEDCREQLDDEGKRHIEPLRAASLRMSKLIDHLLTLSRLNRKPLNRCRVDLSAMVTEIARSLQEENPDRTVQIRIEPHVSAPAADPELIRNALQNLLDNAWKFTRGGEPAVIEFGTENDENNDTVYYVRDNGAGFDMRYADQLFTPFQRLHREDEFAGTGIGLASTRRIILRHGGDIWAAAAVGKGACFRFTLPPAQTADGPDPGAAVPAGDP